MGPGADQMLGEGESRALPPGGLDVPRWSGARLRVAVHAHPGVAASVALLGLATASAALRAFLVGLVHGPLVFMDELGYERMALTFAHTGHFSLFGKAGLAYSPLYPIVLSPVYLLTSSMQTAYEWVKVENAVLVSLSVFPVYAIARSVLSRGRSLGVAALSLVAPLMLYSSWEMSESLAYPLGLVGFWAILRSVRRPSAAGDALLLGTILLASAARLQMVALLPAALTAIVLVALIQAPSAGLSRSRGVVRAIFRHRLLFGVVAVVFVAFVARWLMNGGALPLAGRYANVGTANASPLRVVELFFQHLAEFDLAVGVVPFAAALFAGYALVRLGFPRRALVFASVAVASTFWLLLEVAFDAAAFDTTNPKAPKAERAFSLPRIHERYLIYLVPFFLVTLLVVLPLLRKMLRARWHLAIACAVAVLPALIPFGTVMNGNSQIDSFGLQAFGRIDAAGRLVSAPHATAEAVAIAGVLALGYLGAALRRLSGLAVFVTVVALVGMSAIELERMTTPTSHAAFGLPTHRAWVDRAVGGGSEVSLVGGDRVPLVALEQTAFGNQSVTRIYHTCASVFGASFGVRPLTLDRASGVLRDPVGIVRTRYAVVPADFHVSGRVLARDTPGRLVLVAPSGGVLRVPAGSHSLLRCPG